MAPKTITVEELELMSPADRDHAFDASIVLDLDQVDPLLLDRIRGQISEHIHKSPSPSDA